MVAAVSGLCPTLPVVSMQHHHPQALVATAQAIIPTVVAPVAVQTTGAFVHPGTGTPADLTALGFELAAGHRSHVHAHAQQAPSSVASGIALNTLTIGANNGNGGHMMSGTTSSMGNIGDVNTMVGSSVANNNHTLLTSDSQKSASASHSLHSPTLGHKNNVGSASKSASSVGSHLNSNNSSPSVSSKSLKTPSSSSSSLSSGNNSSPNPKLPGTNNPSSSTSSLSSSSSSTPSSSSSAHNLNQEQTDDLVKPVFKDGELVLEVECGQNKGILYLSKLCQGSKGPCISFQSSWLTPNEFQFVSGRETAKDWKRSIRHHGKSLKLLLAKGILNVHPTMCDCDGCRQGATLVSHLFLTGLFIIVLLLLIQ